MFANLTPANDTGSADAMAHDNADWDFWAAANKRRRTATAASRKVKAPAKHRERKAKLPRVTEPKPGTPLTEPADNPTVADIAPSSMSGDLRLPLGSRAPGPDAVADDTREPAKPTNRAEQSAAESVERDGGTKRNAELQSMVRTYTWGGRNSAAEKCALRAAC
jgi:hypothetical protein